ncbi:MAG: PilN domain-containing protein [Opitutales bacterium]|nr:PilN domain-containing protein [Opitutales bacterium]
MADSLRSEILPLKSSLFFTKIVETPKRIGKKDLFGYARAELEMSAPLPMSQISFCCAKGARCCVIFAALSERLREEELSANFGASNNTKYIIPEIAPLIYFNFKDGFNVVETKGSVIALFTEKGTIKEILHKNFSSENCEGIKKELAEKWGAKNIFEYSFAGFEKQKVAGFKCMLKGKHCAALSRTFSAGELECCDVRGFGYFSERRASKAKSLAAKFPVYGVFFFAAFLAVLTALFYAKNASYKTLKAQVEQIAPEATKLEKLNSQLSAIRDISAKKLFNAMLLAKANSVRPEGVLFLRTFSSNPAEIEIFGSAANISLINDYVLELKKQPFVGNVENEVSAKNGAAKFSLKIKFAQKK